MFTTVQIISAAGIAIKRVDGEVTSGGILGPFGGEGDGRAAAVGRNVLTQRGDFVGHVIRDDGDGTVFDARRHGGEACGFDGGHYRVG